MQKLTLVPIIILSALCLSCGSSEKTNNDQGTATAEEPNIVISILETPANPQSGEPNLFATRTGTPILSWIEQDVDSIPMLMLASWDRAQWSSAAMITKNDNLFVNWADFPALASNKTGVLLVNWLAKSAASPYAYDIKMSLSHNFGATWGDPFILHDDGTQSEHGFVSMVPLANNNFAVTWLDGRETINEGGTMTLRYASIAPEGTLTEEALLDSKVCDCCQTSMVRAGDSTLIVAYRDRSDEEIRDISIVRKSGDSWSEPIQVSNDQWKINGCPVNGPALAASKSLVVVSWYTQGTNDSGKVYCAFSSDFGKTFAAPIRIDSGTPTGRVDIAFVDETTAITSWLEELSGRARIAVRTVNQDGALSSPMTVTESSTSRLSGFSRIAAVEDYFLIAWTELNEQPIVRTAKITVQ